MNSKQFREFIAKPALAWLAYWVPQTQEAEDLVMETIYHESGGCELIRQVPQGPGRGVPQIDAPTFNWLWASCPRDLRASMVVDYGSIYFERIIESLALAVIFTRLRYWFGTKDPIPSTLEARAAYWGKFYNTRNDPVYNASYVADAKKYNL